MEKSLTLLLENFHLNPEAAQTGMRSLMELDAEAFWLVCIPILRKPSNHPGVLCLLKVMAGTEALLRGLCNPEVFTLAEAVQLTALLNRLQPNFDMKLIRVVLDNPDLSVVQSAQKIPAAIRLLDIVTQLPDQGRLTVISQFLQHSNPRVQSKAALLIGQSKKSLKWAEQQLQEVDPRVRANVVESLWAVPNGGARNIFIAAARDQDNRVAGNAVLGLYRLGDASSIGLLARMAGSEDAKTRATAAWVMGETGDSRFLSLLQRQISSETGNVRSNVFGAIGKLNQRKKALVAGSLAVHATRPCSPPNGDLLLGVDVHDDRGRHLDCTPNNLVVWDRNRLVCDYQVFTRIPANPVEFYLLVPGMSSSSEVRVALSQTQLPRAASSERDADLWLLCSFALPESSEALSVSSAAKRQETSGTAHLKSQITNGDALHDLLRTAAHMPKCSADLRAIGALHLSVPSHQGQERHLILIDDPAIERMSERELDRFGAAIQAARMSLHVLSNKQDNRLAITCAKTKGHFIPLTEWRDLPQTLQSLYDLLTSQFRLTIPIEGLDRATCELRVESVCGERAGSTILPLVPQPELVG